MKKSSSSWKKSKQLFWAAPLVEAEQILQSNPADHQTGARNSAEVFTKSGIKFATQRLSVSPKTRSKSVLIFAQSLLLFFSLLRLNGQEVNWQQAIPIDSSVYTNVLDNGFRYYIRANDEPRNRAEFRLLVKAGSLQEEADQLGVAHFVEHMAFNGTRRFPQNKLIDFIERNGSRFGADLNASTSFAETIYKLQVQTDSLNLIDTAIQIMADWASEVQFATEEVDKERGVIRSEWRSGLSTNQRQRLKAYTSLLDGSRYAERLPIGSPELIDTVSPARLQDFYRRWYQPANMALVVVGNIDPEWIESQIKNHFSALKNNDFEPAASYPLDTTARRKFLLITDNEAPFTRWEVTFQLENTPAENTLGSLRERLLFDLYGRMLNKRLAALRETAVPPFTFAYSGFSGLPGNYRTYRISAMCKPEEVAASLHKLVEETRRVVLHGFSEEEFETERSSTIDQFQQMARELDKRSSASITNSIQQAFLSDENITDLSEMPTLVEKSLENIPARYFKNLVETALAATVQTVIVTTNSTFEEMLPDSSLFFRQLDDYLKLDPPPLRAQKTIGRLLELDEPLGEAKLVAFDSTLAISTYELSNQVVIHLKPTDFKNDQIRFQAFSPGGFSLYTDEDYPSAKHALAIQDLSGLDTLKESELLRVLSDQQLSIGPYISEYEEGLSGSSNQEDLETFFQLAYLYFTKARFDSLALQAYLERQLSIYERLDEDPRTAFGRMVIDRKYDHHPRRPNSTISEFSQIRLSKSDSIYRERFANAADFQFLFVGSFDVDSLLHLARLYLANLPTGTERESWKDSGLRLSAQALDTLVIAGQTPKAEVILEWHGRFPFSDRDERLHFSTLRELLSTRLREELRERLGGVYAVRVSSRYNSIPDSVHHTAIRFNAEPGQVDTLIQSIYREINKIAMGEIEMADIEKINATRRKAYQEALRNNNFWLSQIRQCLQHEYPFEVLYPGYYEERLEAITIDGIANTAKMYLQEAIPFKFILLPESVSHND